MKPAPKPIKRGRGRPRTNVEYDGISVRFIVDEKRRLVKAARKLGASQARFINAGTMRLVERVEAGVQTSLSSA